MTFECTNCQLRYRIDDSLIPPEGARVKCRRCSALIEVPAPVIELAPVDLELIPPPPPKRAPRFEEPVMPPQAARHEEPALSEPGPASDPQPASVSEAARAPEPAYGAETLDESANEGDGVTLEQQLAAEARSVQPSPDIEHDSFVERFAAPSPASIPADPVFEHIGHAAALASAPPPALETMAQASVDAAPAPAVEPPPSFDSIPARDPVPAPSLEAAPAPVLEASPEPAAPPDPAPALGAPALASEPPRLEISTMAPAPTPAPPPPLAAPAEPAGSAVLTAAPPAPSAPVLSGASEPSPDPGPVASDNVVPLTFGTPIPEGLSPEERARHEKARRLARVLASDIAIYNREKKERGMAEGNLVAVLGYEIKKSWETYKERVGADFANSTPYFRDALNDLLAEGKKIF